MSGKNTLSNRILLILLLVIAAAFFVSFIIINFWGFDRFCTADMYEDTYVSRLMWEQKTIFPENWIFGNQYYVGATPVLAALLYGILGSANTATALATTVMTVLILVSFYWMVRPFATKSEAVFGTFVLLAAVAAPDIVNTIEGQTLYLMASFYAIYLITYLVVMGDYLRSLCGKRKRFFSVSLVFACLLSFMTGMQSLRQTAIMIVPIVAYEGISWLAAVIRTKKLYFPFREKHTLRALIITVSNLLGYGLISLINPPHYSMYGTLALNSSEEMASKLTTCGRALRGISGLCWLYGDTPCIPIGILGAVLIFFAVCALFVYLGSRKKKKDGLMPAYIISLVSILTVLLAGILLDVILRRIYLFIWYPFVAIAAMVFIKCFRRSARVFWTALILILAVGNLYFGYLPCVTETLSPDDSPEQQACEWLTEHGYTRIYGYWTSTCRIAARSDGRIDAGTWYDGLFHILDYINPQDIYTEEDNEKAVYCFEGWDTVAAESFARDRGVELKPVARFGDYNLYTGSRQLMYKDRPLPVIFEYLYRYATGA